MFIDVEEQSDDFTNSRLTAQHKEKSMNIDKHFLLFLNHKSKIRKKSRVFHVGGCTFAEM